MAKIAFTHSHRIHRIMELENALGTSVCEQFRREGIVCPAKLPNGLYTVAAYDNLDYNPSSSTSHDSFHGTRVSLFLYRSNMEGGEKRDIPLLFETAKNKSIVLPMEFTEIEPLLMRNDTLLIPSSSPIELDKNSKDLWSLISQNEDWILNLRMTIDTNTFMNTSWVGYH